MLMPEQYPDTHGLDPVEGTDETPLSLAIARIPMPPPADYVFSKAPSLARLSDRFARHLGWTLYAPGVYRPLLDVALEAALTAYCKADQDPSIAARSSDLPETDYSKNNRLLDRMSGKRLSRSPPLADMAPS